MRFFLGVVLLALALPAVGQSRGPVLPNQGLEIVQRFGGIAKMVVSEELESKEPQPLLITSQTEFDRFASQLPSMDIGKDSGPIPNADPLVKGPRFDWSRFMLLVVFDSQSLSFPPNINRVEVQGQNLVAYIEYPGTNNLVEAKPPEIGSYGAALVVRSDRPLTWNNPGRKAQEAQRQSMMMFLPKTAQ
jgi:hypothetical protein